MLDCSVCVCGQCYQVRELVNVDRVYSLKVANGPRGCVIVALTATGSSGGTELYIRFRKWPHIHYINGCLKSWIYDNASVEQTNLWIRNIVGSLMMPNNPPNHNDYRQTMSFDGDGPFLNAVKEYILTGEYERKFQHWLKLTSASTGYKVFGQLCDLAKAFPSFKKKSIPWTAALIERIKFSCLISFRRYCSSARSTPHIGSIPELPFLFNGMVAPSAGGYFSFRILDKI